MLVITMALLAAGAAAAAGPAATLEARVDTLERKFEAEFK